MRALLVALLFTVFVRSQQALPDPPAGATLQAAERRCADAFTAEYAQTARTARREFARKLAAAGRETTDDPGVRFVLLRDAGQVAAEAGDGAFALDAVAMLASEFRVDAWRMKLARARTAAKASGSASERTVAAELLLGLGESALAAEHFEVSEEAAKEAALLGQGQKEQGRLAAERDALARLAAEWKTALAALASRADDGAAHTTVGKMLCALARDWRRGCEHFLASGDSALQAIARGTVTVESDPTPRAQFDLATAWWDLSQREQGRLQRAFAARAAALYEQALPGLAPVDRAIATKRLAGSTPAAGNPAKTTPAEAAAAPRIADDQLQQWPVGARVSGWRVSEDGCTLEGTVVRSDEQRLEIELHERWTAKNGKPAHEQYRWVFERVRRDPKTGRVTYKVCDAERIPTDNTHRRNFRGEMTIDGGTMTGTYEFDYGKTVDPGTQNWRLQVAPPGKDDQLRLWPVGTRVEGRRDIATLQGTVTRNDENGIEFELTESWTGRRNGREVSFRVRWIFDRTKLDAKTGECTYKLTGGQVLNGKNDRSNYRGTMTIKNERMTGKYAFDFGSTKVEDVEQVWELKIVK